MSSASLARTMTHLEPDVVPLCVDDRQVCVVENNLERLQQTYGAEKAEVVLETELFAAAPQVMHRTGHLKMVSSVQESDGLI